MEEAASSSIENRSNSSEAINTAFSRQLIMNDSSDLSTKERDSPSTDLVVSEEASSSPPIVSPAIESDSQDHRKSTNTGSHVISDLISDNIKDSSSSEVPNETSTTELSEVPNKQSLPSSTDTRMKKSKDEIWTTDSEYGVSLRKFHEAFDRAVDTVIDLVKNRVCGKEMPGSNAADLAFEKMMSPFPPGIVPALQTAAFLRAAQKGEGEALAHLLSLGARGDGTDGENRNALHLACIGGWDNCVYVLLDLKSISRTKGRVTASSWDPKTDFEAVDVYSKTPLDYAKEKDPNSDCVSYIECAIELQYNKRVRKVKKKS